MMIVPLSSVPNQIVYFGVGAPNIIECAVKVYQKTVGMFLDLSVEGTVVLSGILCRNLTPLVINSYFGFPGDLVFVDSLGINADPLYTGLGSRWYLVYVTSSDVASSNLDPVFQ